tara:strand:- start:595 stop:1476 length:882 start_codon:yes stop_codon:yes gene_type:complete
MKRIKHNKIKNTGILFELLMKQITADILNDNKNSKAIGMIKNYFAKTKPLGQELQLYKMLTKENVKTESKATKFLDIVVEYRNKLNNSSIRREKYNLIKEIKEHYPIDDFFKSSVRNYKMLASIYKLFEFNGNSEYSPKDIFTIKETILEHLYVGKKIIKKKINKSVLEYKKQDKDLRLLAYKILVDNFNSKYKTLNVKQRNLLREYINNVSNTNLISQFILKETLYIKNTLKKLIPTINDKTTKIKVKAAYKQLSEIFNVKSKVRDKHILSMMRYYELIKEIRNVNKKSSPK